MRLTAHEHLGVPGLAVRAAAALGLDFAVQGVGGINAHARINIPSGTSLTALAQLPASAERSLTDPYAEKPARWPLYAGMVLVLLMAAVYWWVLPRGG